MDNWPTRFDASGFRYCGLTRLGPKRCMLIYQIRRAFCIEPRRLVHECIDDMRCVSMMSVSIVLQSDKFLFLRVAESRFIEFRWRDGFIRPSVVA